MWTCPACKYEGNEDTKSICLCGFNIRDAWTNNASASKTVPECGVVKQCPNCRKKIMNAEGIPAKLAICTNCGAPLYLEHFQGVITCPSCKINNSYSPTAISPNAAVCGSCHNPMFPKIYMKSVSGIFGSSMGDTRMLGNFKAYKIAVEIILTLIVLPVVLYYLFSSGGYFAKQKAIETVQGVNISINISNSTVKYTLEELIKKYNFEKKTLPIANSSGGRGVFDVSAFDRAGGNTSLPWEAQYIGGKFAVGCRYEGHLISFETDTINVIPISDDAKEIFNLKNGVFNRQ